MPDNDNATRAAYTAGLRQLADILDNHPEVPLPYEGRGSAITINFLHGDDPKAELTAAARVFPGTLTKNAWGSGDRNYFSLEGKLDGVKISLDTYRDVVCERVVTGTREVEVEEPDPKAVEEAIAALPKQKRVQIVEDVRWKCTPLLAPADDDAEAVSA